MLISLIDAHFTLITAHPKTMAECAEEGGEDRRHLCDEFLDRLAGLINKDNVNLILSEQEGM